MSKFDYTDACKNYEGLIQSSRIMLRGCRLIAFEIDIHYELFNIMTYNDNYFTLYNYSSEF